MNRLDQVCRSLRARHEGALVAYITAGDPFPTVAGIAEVALTLAEAGVDILELGLPYSDPLADGPSIQASSQRALDRGVTPPLALNAVREIRKRSDIPVVLMTYYNLVLQYGLARFADAMQSVGADAVILTDLPPEEAGPWKREADAHALSTIFLLAPTSTQTRIDAVTKSMNSGFVYCVSRTGVTGARSDVPSDLRALLDSIRARTDLPLYVGFGISAPEHVRQVVSFADGAVIGSALVDFLAKHAEDNDWKTQVTALVRSWKEATRVAG